MSLCMIHSVKLRLFILSIRVGRFLCLITNELIGMLLASLKTIFVDKEENILTLLQIIGQVSTLKRIVMTKKLEEAKEQEIRKKAKDAGIEIMTFNQLRVRVRW